MNILDFHTHAYPDKIADRLTGRMAAFVPGIVRHGSGTVTELLARNAKNGITHCVQLNIAATAASVDRMNRFAIETDKLPGVIAFGTLHPDQTPEQVAKQLALLKAAGIRGIKLQPVSQKFFIDEPRAMALYEQIVDADMLVLIHCGADPADGGIDHAPPEKTAYVLDTFPAMRAVLAHLGGMNDWGDAERLIWGRDVYIDMAMTDVQLHADALQRLLAKHPHDRILYGSDYPWHDTEELDFVKTLPEALQQKILWQNAARLLGLSE